MGSTPNAERPNIVMILADDQSYRDFGFMGNDLIHTPNLDNLAKASARYPNGYVPMSVCRPSLATLLTGLYPHQHGIHFNHPPPGLGAMMKMTGKQYRQTRAPGKDKSRLPSGLFDLRTDPHETNNLLDVMSQRPRVEEMTRLLDRWWNFDSKK